LIHGQGGRQAQRLTRLNIRGLELNPGTITFILQNLPNLSTLEAENLFTVIKPNHGDAEIYYIIRMPYVK
jgi:hypothetical protein